MSRTLRASFLMLISSLTLSAAATAADPHFRRADTNDDGTVNLSDDRKWCGELRGGDQPPRGRQRRPLLGLGGRSRWRWRSRHRGGGAESQPDRGARERALLNRMGKKARPLSRPARRESGASAAIATPSTASKVGRLSHPSSENSGQYFTTPVRTTPGSSRATRKTSSGTPENSLRIPYSDAGTKPNLE